MACACSKAPCKGFNVVLVVVDTLRADHCVPYGYSLGTTPRLKRFASEGVLFETAVSQASFTMASMGTMMTSTYPHHHGAGRHPSLLGDWNRTMAEAYRSAGYATGAIVCNPLLAEASGFSQGFDTYAHLEEKEGGNAEGIIARGVRWIEEHKKKPFFLWLHLLDPHFPYVPRYGFTRVNQGDREAHKEYTNLLKRKNTGKIAVGEIFFECPLSPAAVEDAIRAYDSEIAFVDQQFGVLLDAIKRLGLSKNTLVVFTSDHGENLWEKDLHFCHGFSVYDAALKVPLILRTPGLQNQGMRFREPVRLLDLMPTLLHLTGVNPLASMRGRDLLPLIDGTSLERRKTGPPAFSESEPMYLDQGVRRYPLRKRIYLEGDKGKWRSVRAGRYKLIMIPKQGGPELELFDLLEDPNEEKEIHKNNPRITGDLLKLLKKWLSDPTRQESVSTPELDEEWTKRLQGIGYIK